MGACPAKPAKPDDVVPPFGAQERSPSDVAASELVRKVSTNVDPVMLRTRGVTKKDVLDQRRTATAQLSSLRDISPETSVSGSSAAAQLRSSRLALGAPAEREPLSRRMSRLTTMGRRQIVEGIQVKG